MNSADILAHCRAGLDTEQIISILTAITSPMEMDDPVCGILEFCNDKLMSIQEAQRIRAIDVQEAELWEQDDAACKRGAASGAIPAFLLAAV